MRRLDALMVLLFIGSTVLVILAHESPLARAAFCELSRVCPRFDTTGFWKKLGYDLGMGSLMSIAFYGLLVRLPEEQKRRRLRASLKRHYEMFKEDSISLFAGAADGSYRPEHVRTLLNQERFRSYFQEDVGEGQDRWARAISNLNENNLQELVVGMEIFRDEVSYILNNTDIRLDGAFAFFKGLSSQLHFARSSAALDYDSLKQLARFYWRVLSGWDSVKGYPKGDVVERMIRSI